MGGGWSHLLMLGQCLSPIPWLWGRRCRSPSPLGAAFASCWFPQVPGASDRHLLLVPGTGDLVCWERECLGAPGDFPGRAGTWEFSAPRFSASSSSSGSHSHATPGVTNCF